MLQQIDERLGSPSRCGVRDERCRGAYMPGIVSYGVYIPLFRLGKITAGWDSPGERTIANFDEDSLTMGVAALRQALTASDAASVDALYFASTTSPYAEKQSATTIGWAANLRTDIFTVD